MSNFIRHVWIKMKCVQSDQMTRVVGAILQGYEDDLDLALPSDVSWAHKV